MAEIVARADGALDAARRQFLQSSGCFDSAWYGHYCPEAAGSDDMLRHYLERGAPQGVAPNAWWAALAPSAALLTEARSESSATDAAPSVAASVLELEVALIAASGLFDTAYYLQGNPDVAAAGMNPLRHFCASGWRELRKPCRDFDVWWYWACHLDPAREALNPLVHYIVMGRAAGLQSRPSAYRPAAGCTWPAGHAPRRLCLFAGYDRDGLVDDYVVAYVRELSLWADVYYLADGNMREAELAKLAPYVKGSWVERHGQYDFGSWSRLAKRYVGWDVIEACDELLLVNDSAYLLKPLADVFSAMDARRCDWWGLQATKGLASTRGCPSNQFTCPVPMMEVKGRLLDEVESDPIYDFHVGSYFLAYRKPVIGDAGFRRLLDSVTEQRDKRRVVLKYEVGLTHYLLGRQYDFSTYMGQLYPFHPLFTEWYFELLREGFPLLKRYLISNNHYNVPDLVDWKARILASVPGADVDAFERNLWRVADDDKLKRSLSIVRGNDGAVVAPSLLHGRRFEKADALTPKYDHWWAFPVCAFTHVLAGNERAVFEEVKDDPSIKKIVLTRSRRQILEGENVVVVPLHSTEGQHYLMRARQIFIKHSATRNLDYPVSPSLHNIVNLWHGIPLKRIGYASLDMQDRLEAQGKEHARCRAVISSSKIDTLAMAAAFYPLSYNEVWCTGLPRNDFVLRPHDRLPADLREESDRLKRLLGGRRLVLFAPTFRLAQGDAYYRFAAAEVDWLHAWLRDNGLVLGVREHMADTSRVYYNQLRGDGVVELGDRDYVNVEILYRHAAALLTDYSSAFIDFLLTGRPVVSFAYDYASYAGEQRGLFYDMEHVFPGPVCKDFKSLRSALNGILDPPAAIDRARYEWKRRVFFDYLDDASSRRVVRRAKSLYRAKGSC